MAYTKYMINPYEFWEAQAAANLLHCVAGGDMNQRREYAATVKDRFGEVGGLPRYLFCNSSTYSAYKRDLLIASQDAVELWNSIQISNNVNNIRSSAEFLWLRCTPTARLGKWMRIMCACSSYPLIAKS